MSPHRGIGPAFWAWLIAAGPWAPAGEPVLDVTLTVWDIAGVERREEVCSTGVPLPCGILKEPEGIAVFDSAGKAVPAQFRVLERWREKAEGKDDLSVKWMLVTFFANVPAGKSAAYRLKTGQNPAPPWPIKAEEKVDAWEMGGLVFKKDFTSPFKLILTDPDGRELGTAGQEIRWSVWENGPVRACLKAESPTNPAAFGFIAWIYAYAGQKRWDLTVVLKNAPDDCKGPFYFRDFSVVWEPPGIQGAADFILGGEWGKAVAGRLEGGGPVYLHQESDGTDAWETFGKDGQMSPVLDWTADKSKCKAGRPAFRGYKVLAGEKELGAGNFAAGWAALNSGGAGGFAAVRDYYVQYPKATEVAPGRMLMRLWPRYTRAFGGLHWLDDCTRKGHDLSFRLGPAPLAAAQAEEWSRAFDCPLVARAPAAWYLDLGVVDRSAAAGREKEFAGAAVKAQRGSGRNWVNFGGDVTDQIRRRYHGADLAPFALNGDPAHAYHLHNTARHSSGMTPLWLDDYRYPRDVKKLTHAQYCGLARDAGKYRPGTWHHGYMTWNDSHFCCQEVFDDWRLFGDPLALEALAVIGRWCQAYVDFREGGGGLVAGTRADGLPLHNLCEAWRILGDESMRRSLDRFADVCWKQVDKERGNYGVMAEWEGGKDPCEKPFMMAQVMKGLRGYYEVTGSERAADQIYGMTDFILGESAIGPWGFKYVVMIDPEKNWSHLASSLEAAEKDGKHVSYGDLAWVLAWVHRRYGDERFRKMIDGINPKGYPYVSRAYTAYYPERTDRTPPDAVKDLTAQALGGGRVSLSWTAPAGEPVLYQVKWSDKPMVERLKYPEEKDAKGNWWAANYVEGEPTPGFPGAKETMTVENVAPGKRTFAVRSFDSARNRSALGNLAEVEVK